MDFQRVAVFGLVLGGCGVVASAQPVISLTTIANSDSTYVPVGKAPALEGNQVAFLARTGNNGPDVILTGPIAGPFQVVARDGDPIPGIAANYSQLGNPDLSGGAVYFEALGGHLFRWEQGAVERIYNRISGAGAALSIPRANAHAVISYVDNAPNFPSGTADVYQTDLAGSTTLIEQCRRRVTGVAAAKGDWFVFLPVGSQLSVASIQFPAGTREIITDVNDIVPAVGNPFSSYVGTSTDGASASYIGITAFAAQSAVCVSPLGMNNSGSVEAVAVSAQSAPGGGTFSSFEETALGSRVLFYKGWVSGQSGIFCHADGANHQVLRSGGLYQGRSIIDVDFGGASADVASAVFRLRYSNPALPGGIGYALLRSTVALPSIPGDIDGDGDVDLGDLTLLLASFGSCVGDTAFNAAADFDGSGCVDLGDLTVLLANFGT